MSDSYQELLTQIKKHVLDEVLSELIRRADEIYNIKPVSDIGHKVKDAAEKEVNLLRNRVINMKNRA